MLYTGPGTALPVIIHIATVLKPQFYKKLPPLTDITLTDAVKITHQQIEATRMANYFEPVVKHMLTAFSHND